MLKVYPTGKSQGFYSKLAYIDGKSRFDIVISDLYAVTDVFKV